MNIQVALTYPAGMPELFNGWQLGPLAGLGVIDVEVKFLSDLVVSTTYNQHKIVEKEDRMLIPCMRNLPTSPVWRFHPVKLSIAVFSEAPCIIQC
jgi:hypothetical protein